LHVRRDLGASEAAGCCASGVEGLQVEPDSVGIVVDEVGVVFVGIFLLFGCGLGVFGEDGEPAAVGGDVEVFDVEGEWFRLGAVFSFFCILRVFVLRLDIGLVSRGAVFGDG